MLVAIASHPFTAMRCIVLNESCVAEWNVSVAVESAAATCATSLLPFISSAYGHAATGGVTTRSEEHTSELQSRLHLVCRLLLEKKKQTYIHAQSTKTQH